MSAARSAKITLLSASAATLDRLLRPLRRRRGRQPRRLAAEENAQYWQAQYDALWSKVRGYVEARAENRRTFREWLKEIKNERRRR